MQVRSLVTVVALGLCILSAGALAADTNIIAAWEFDSESDLKVWKPNGHLKNAAIANGVLSAEATDWDPFFQCIDASIQATPWQVVLLRIRANKPGAGQLFWSGTFEGQHGGLTQDKMSNFDIPVADEWTEIALFPFWQTEGEIRQFRLDVYDGARFEVDWIRLVRWGEGEPTTPKELVWRFAGDTSSWHIADNAPGLFAPPLRFDPAGKHWATLALRSETDGIASLLWATRDTVGLHRESFPLRGDGKRHYYNLFLEGVSAWSGEVVAFGLSLPEGDGVRLESIRLGAERYGPPELDVRRLGFENAPNRAGNPARVLAQVTSLGGKTQGFGEMQLQIPPGLRLLSAPENLSLDDLRLNEPTDFVWELQADTEGEYPVTLRCTGPKAPEPTTVSLRFSKPLGLAKADYVPKPEPVKTDIDIVAYYFPGWNNDAKWDCIRHVAPERKPVLGYYDEGNVECVDWQIKWAVESGIKCFLVDWYWVGGHEQLLQWFEAYRKARYRDMLDVAIMWANHNPAGTHTVEDWRNVTQKWIDDYFNLPGYYQIDGKPAVYIWNPSGIRGDVGGPEVVKSMLAESQEMARAAGYAGIQFYAMNRPYTASEIPKLADEGYVGMTNYHEWGWNLKWPFDALRYQFKDVVSGAPKTWRTYNDATKGTLEYQVVADTGWDSRPWHGVNAMAILDRTPDLFEQLLREAKTFCAENDKDILVLGPMNEWGEGSYIEPCVEFEFEMLDAVRDVFGKGDPSTWPIRIAPTDVGRGPFPHKQRPSGDTWTFQTDGDIEGWQGNMQTGDMRCEGGVLRFRTLSHDPVIYMGLSRLQTSKYVKLVVKMRLTGDLRANEALQVFWQPVGGKATEGTSVRAPLKQDGQMHTYTFDLASHPRWRGPIASLRLDPGDVPGIEVEIEEIRLVKGE